MNKKVLLILITFFCFNTLLSVLSSCERERGCGSDCSTPTCFYVDSLTVIPFDEFDNQPISTANVSVHALKLRFDITTGGHTSYCYNTPKRTELSFFSKAIACSPVPCPVLMKGDSLVAYNIFSDKDYDSSHLAGSSLNDIITSDGFPVRTDYDNGPVEVTKCSFRFNTSPADTGRHIFTLQFTQQDGNVISLTTQQIKLL